MANCFKVLTRKKVVDPAAVTETQLARVLNTFDLTALGVGSTLGVGVYILAGHVAKETAGPAVVLSFLIAAIASVFAGLCYAEFGSRVPRAGSAYVYSYVTIGELIAFIIGWNLILEYVIGSASVARGFSLYLDTLLNHTLENTFKEIAPINVSFMSEYFDFFSFGLTLLLSGALAFGMKESSRLNNVFTILNIFIVIFVVIAGSIKAQPKNWHMPPPNSTFGTGGFFPYGMSGVIKGAATCFYGFVGFDCIATTGEEVKNPQRAIPLSIIASLLIIFLAYFSTATVLTLMVPYYSQDTEAPIPHAFADVGWEWAKWIVAIGGMFGLCASLFGAMFPLPRIIYAMASDGIIFRFLGKVSPRFHTPLVGTLLAGLLTGLMSALFELSQLVAMMSIGTLLAYTIVAACVLLLRYSKDDTRAGTELPNNEYTINSEVENIDSSSNLVEDNEDVTFGGIVKQTFNFKRLENPTKTSQALVSVQICTYALLSLVLGLCIMYLSDELRHAHIWAIALVIVICALMLLILLSIVLQPTSKTEVRFKVPLVPLIPALSIVINIYLMLMLDVYTWIRFGVWMAVGLPMYFICVRGSECSSNSNTSYKPHKLSNGHISITNHKNGYLNSNFLTDNTVVLEENKEDPVEATQNHSVQPKLKPKAPSPPSEVKTSSPNLFSDSLSINDALAALDDVLLKEENASSMYEKPLDRKVSIDTVSNASNVHYEESVIALIHREDIRGDETIPIIEEQSENDVQSDNLSLKSEALDDELENAVALVSDVDKSEEVENETSEVVKPNIPPPPSMEEYENYLTRKIPRISVRQSMTEESKEPPPDYPGTDILNEEIGDLANKVESTPSPDFIRKKQSNEIPKSESENASPYNELQEQSDENITFGSKQHKQVMSKLNQLFERRSLGLASPTKLTKLPTTSESEDQPRSPVAVLPGMKPVLDVIPKLNAQNDNLENSEVVEEVMKPADIKKKLDEILKADPRLTIRPLKSNIAVSNLIDQSELNKEVPALEEVKNSSTVVNSESREVVDLPDKSSSIEEIKPANKDTSNSDISAKEKHKNLMMNTLNSIKLRKLESLTLAEG